MNTHYPSRQQVLEKIQPELDWIRKHTIYAEYEEPSTPAINYHEVVGEKGTIKVAVATPTSNPLLEDHVRFLSLARTNSADGLKRLYDRLKFGVERGNRILRELKALGYVVVNEVRPINQKSGRSRLIVALTAKGEQRLNAFEKRASE